MQERWKNGPGRSMSGRSPTRWNLTKNLDGILPQSAIRELWNLTSRDAIIATGVGQHQMWSAQFYKFRRPRDWLSSAGLGTMGFGLPAAIGAEVAIPIGWLSILTGMAVS